MEPTAKAGRVRRVSPFDLLDFFKTGHPKRIPTPKISIYCCTEYTDRCYKSWLDVFSQKVKLILLCFCWGVIDILHVGTVHPEHAETVVDIRTGFRTDFIPGPADALLADVADGGIACFAGFAIFTTDFRELD